MRIGRAIIIPAILALSVAGSVLSAAEISAGTVQAPATHTQQSTITVGPSVHYHN